MKHLLGCNNAIKMFAMERLGSSHTHNICFFSTKKKRKKSGL